MTKTFLLGVGAQKAGTTWLYRYLRGHPACAMPDTKELGVFSAHYQPELFPGATVAKLRALQATLENRLKLARKGTPHLHPRQFLDQLDSLAMEIDPTRYPGYFDRLLRARPGAVLTGDITPQYGSLTAAQFTAIRALLEGAGYAVRVVFLMRDPLERCYSAIRMDERNKAQRPGAALPVPAPERFAAVAQEPWCEIRTRYERMVPALDAAFDPDQLFYGFYESFISEPEVQRLCGFLGLPFHKPETGHRANASPRAADPAPADIALVRAFYDETYRFCADRFGAQAVAALWKHA